MADIYGSRGTTGRCRLAPVVLASLLLLLSSHLLAGAVSYFSDATWSWKSSSAAVSDQPTVDLVVISAEVGPVDDSESIVYSYDAADSTRFDVSCADLSRPESGRVRGLSGLSASPGTAAQGTSTTPSHVDVATEAAAGSTRVGRWMGADEHVAMVETGQVQVGRGGTTYVASPANAESYMSQAAPGSHYVEFDVPSSSLRPAGQPGWAQIPTAENTMWGKLAPQRGWDVPESPVPACNIVHVATKPSC
jgi:hypothetical protein